MPEAVHFAEFARKSVPVGAAAAAPAAGPTGIDGLFENLGIATPAERLQLNKALTHLRLLVAEDGRWLETAEHDLVQAWEALGRRKQSGKVGADVAQVLREFASNAALQQRGVLNQPPYTSGSAADSARERVLASL